MYSVKKNPEGRVSKDDNHPLPLFSSFSMKIGQEEKEKVTHGWKANFFLIWQKGCVGIQKTHNAG